MTHAIEVSKSNPGPARPHQLGSRLWAPMWLMALMAFTIGTILAAVRAANVAEGASEATLQAQAHLVPAFMFIGFAAVFAAIAFAIARILGVFRSGGADVQLAARSDVHTLKMPGTAKAFIGLMATAMMTLLVAVVLHLVWAAGTASGSITIADSESAAIVLEGVRRLGTALYLFAIALGLVTITTVLRFQAARLREL